MTHKKFTSGIKVQKRDIISEIKRGIYKQFQNSLLQSDAIEKMIKEDGKYWLEEVQAKQPDAHFYSISHHKGKILLNIKYGKFGDNNSVEYVIGSIWNKDVNLNMVMKETHLYNVSDYMFNGKYNIGGEERELIFNISISNPEILLYKQEIKDFSNISSIIVKDIETENKETLYWSGQSEESGSGKNDDDKEEKNKSGEGGNSTDDNVEDDSNEDNEIILIDYDENRKVPGLKLITNENENKKDLTTFLIHPHTGKQIDIDTQKAINSSKYTLANINDAINHDGDFEKTFDEGILKPSMVTVKKENNAITVTTEDDLMQIDLNDKTLYKLNAFTTYETLGETNIVESKEGTIDITEYKGLIKDNNYIENPAANISIENEDLIYTSTNRHQSSNFLNPYDNSALNFDNLRALPKGNILDISTNIVYPEQQIQSIFGKLPQKYI